MASENRFLYMFFALLIFLVVVPIAEDYTLFSDKVLHLVAFSCILLIGVFSLRESGSVFRLGIVLAAIGTVLNVLGYNSTEATYLPWSLIVFFLFLAISIWASMKRVLETDDLSFDRVIGAICVFLLLATIWATMYTFVELLHPGSFNGITDQDLSGWDTRWIYFSFVVLTTLGFGDITPATSTARVLVYSEAVCGIFYMAIMVAGLVSGYLASKHKKD